MSLVTALVTHLPPDAVHATLADLRRAVAPRDIVVCHGGRREDHDALDWDRKLFIEDPSLRSAARTVQSYNELLQRVFREHMRDEPAWDAAIVLEFDQVPLRDDWPAEVERTLAASGADFLGCGCSDRTETNWTHALRWRDDAALLAHLRAVSVRDDPTRVFGCLGTGFVLRRPVLEALADTELHAPSYVELYVPTVVHHLGFAVDDIGRHSRLADEVRWEPEMTLDEVLAAKRAGHFFAHPFKDWRGLPRLRAAVSG